MKRDMLEKGQIMASLEMLARNLTAARQTGEMLLGEEAVMVLIVGSRSSLRTMAASFGQGAVAMRAAADELAWKTGLPTNWLDGKFENIHDVVSSALLWRKYPGLEIYHPALDYVLARKIVANRYMDRVDAQALAQHLNMRSPKLIIQLLQHSIPERDLTPHIQYQVEEWFG